jgi:DNA-binding protein HU-beta
MNKGDLIEAISRDTSLSKQKSAESVESMMRCITFALKGGDNITLSGFGTFSVYQRKARNGRNPQTGELIKIKTCRVAKFSAGSDLRKALARGRADR